MYPAGTALRRSWVSSLRWVPFLSKSPTRESWMEASKGNEHSLPSDEMLFVLFHSHYLLCAETIVSLFFLPFSIHFLSVCSPDRSLICVTLLSKTKVMPYCMKMKRKHSVQPDHAFYCWGLSNNKQCEVTPAVVLFRSSLCLIKNTCL